MTKTKGDGGPAFPSKRETGKSYLKLEQGMSLRDYFAAKAMQALIFGPSGRNLTAKDAYEFADEMLKAKEG